MMQEFDADQDGTISLSELQTRIGSLCGEPALEDVLAKLCGRIDQTGVGVARYYRGRSAITISAITILTTTM